MPVSSDCRHRRHYDGSWSMNVHVSIYGRCTSLDINGSQRRVPVPRIVSPSRSSDLTASALSHFGQVISPRLGWLECAITRARGRLK